MDSFNTYDGAESAGNEPTTVTTVSEGKKKSVTRSQKARLTFPVGRIHSLMKSRVTVARSHSKTSNKMMKVRVSGAAAIYMTCILQYMCFEVLHLAGLTAKKANSKRIYPKHINVATTADTELRRVFSSVTLQDGGVAHEEPQIHYVLNFDTAKEGFNALRKANQKLHEDVVKNINRYADNQVITHAASNISTVIDSMDNESGVDIFAPRGENSDMSNITAMTDDGI